MWRIFSSGLVCLIIVSSPCFGGEKKAEKNSDRFEEADQLLLKISKSYYSVEDSGLRHASCYVKSQNIIDSLGNAMSKALRTSQLEAVFEPGKRITVKAVRKPTGIAPEMHFAIETYVRKQEAVLNDVQKRLALLPMLIGHERLTKKFNLNMEEDGKNRLIVLTAKDTVEAGDGQEEINEKERSLREQRAAEWTKRRAKRREEAAEREPQPRVENNDAVSQKLPIDVAKAKKIVITVSANDQLTQIDVAYPETRDVLKIDVQVKDDKWLIRKLDIASYDKQNRLDERDVTEIKYTTKKGLLLMSKIVLKLADKKGKPIQRRDQVNPVEIDFSKYEVDKK